MKGWVQDLNRAELIDAMQKRADGRLHKYQVEIAVDAFCGVVLDALGQGEKVKLVGFGEWYPKRRAARIGRNPKTNEPVPIPARIMPVFKPGSDMVNAVQGTSNKMNEEGATT